MRGRASSAGCPLFDFTKLFIELAGQQRGTGYPWWEPLFDGYGGAPDLHVMRLLLAASNHINFTCLGDYSWAGDREAILTVTSRETCSANDARLWRGAPGRR
ncbi:hypothetical protein ACFVWG_26665 [Kribbella sp. NPDC058245]|uniref:hypothetical protein n=1 Tax=Kribbella sp. NPDC058245 TaxID=3346399 RepID=UPI0036EBE0BA